MSTTYSANQKLGTPAVNDAGWASVLDRNRGILDALAPVGGLAVTTHEVPSATLAIDVAAGSFVDPSGTVRTYAGVSGRSITANGSYAVYLDGTASWALAVAASYPATPHVRLATVVAGASAISSVADNRQCFVVAGSWADGTNLALGTTSGTQIGTSASQKLGFYGATPVIQQTGGAASAGASYTSTEQGMLNRMYAALRALGLIS